MIQAPSESLESFVRGTGPARQGSRAETQGSGTVVLAGSVASNGPQEPEEVSTKLTPRVADSRGECDAFGAIRCLIFAALEAFHGCNVVGFEVVML